LLARGLDRLRVDETGKLAWITLSLQDFAETGTAFADIGNMVSYPRSIDGVELSILMFEDEPNFVKMSFRSRKALDVNLLAREFGGGGHVRAAGLALHVPLAEAEARVIPRAREVVKQLQSGS
jgi:phosphoesterase RecJ-like protein